MILFCDTSALVKLYLAEAESDAVKVLTAEAEAVAVCRIAWAEAYAALFRRAREVPADTSPIGQARQVLAMDWPRYLIVEVSQAVVEQAGEFADTFALRGYDSVQLAAAYQAKQVSRLPVSFACFDTRLNKAARVLGMDVPFIAA
ncbi:MAG: type II toxin-antitoxin system VapC family toxin [Sulfuricella sp.]|nr:type II toxin-antitoxin system VapC family toxin [Sulfuricella sp.]